MLYFYASLGAATIADKATTDSEIIDDQVARSGIVEHISFDGEKYELPQLCYSWHSVTGLGVGVGLYFITSHFIGFST